MRHKMAIRKSNPLWSDLFFSNQHIVFELMIDRFAFRLIYQTLPEAKLSILEGDTKK